MKKLRNLSCGSRQILNLYLRKLLPLNELNLQYNIFDKISGAHFIDTNENFAYKFNNLITLNEYFIEDTKDKFETKYLRNIILKICTIKLRHMMVY